MEILTTNHTNHHEQEEKDSISTHGFVSVREGSW